MLFLVVMVTFTPTLLLLWETKRVIYKALAYISEIQASDRFGCVPGCQEAICAVKLPTHQPPCTFTKAWQGPLSLEEVQGVTDKAATVCSQIIEIHLTHLCTFRGEQNKWLGICPAFIYNFCVLLLENC